MSIPLRFSNVLNAQSRTGNDRATTANFRVGDDQIDGQDDHINIGHEPGLYLLIDKGNFSTGLVRFSNAILGKR